MIANKGDNDILVYEWIGAFSPSDNGLAIVNKVKAYYKQHLEGEFTFDLEKTTNGAAYNIEMRDLDEAVGMIYVSIVNAGIAIKEAPDCGSWIVVVGFEYL